MKCLIHHDFMKEMQEGNKTINIQVKTKRMGVPDWILGKKAESIKDKNMFYVFVALKSEEESPDYHITPSLEVAKYVINRHKIWLNTLGKGGRPHVDTSIRIWDDPENKYLDRWDLLGLD